MQRSAGLVRTAALASALALAACSTADTTGPGGNNGTPTITIQLSATTLSVAQGTNGSVTVTVTRGGGFTGAVDLAVTGAPNGVTVTPSPSSIGSGSTQATINVAVGAQVAAGNYPLQVRASGTGVQDATLSLTLTVTAAPAGFTLGLSTAALTVTQGQQGTTTVNITRSGGFAGEVALTLTGAPAGVTSAFDPAQTTGNTSTLTLTVGAAVAPGTYTLTVRGNATGQQERTAVLSLTVDPSGSGGGNTQWTFCAASGLPAWFAFQDGNGGWTRVNGTGNQYSFQIASGRGGVAYTIVDGPVSTVTVLFGSQQELADHGAGLCGANPSTKTLNGSVANVGPLETASITMGNANAVVNASTGNDFTLENVDDGPQDLVAGRTAQTIGPGGVAIAMNKGIIRRGLNLANGATIPVLDFNAAEAFTPATNNFTIGNLNGDGTVVTNLFLTAGGTAGVLYIQSTGNTNATQPFYSVPGANQQAGDLHMITVSAVPGSLNPETFRNIVRMYVTPADLALTLGPTIGAVTVSAPTTTPYARLRTQYTIQNEYAKYWSASFTQNAAGNTRTVILSATAAWLDGAATFDLQIPDFSGVADWNNAWGPAAGALTSWSFTATGWSTGGGTTATPGDGIVVLSGSRLGTITP